MKFRAVFLDIDDTLFDFRKSPFEALVTAFAEIGVSFTEADMPHYEVYNNRMWEMFERGEIEKEHIYEERFRLYFAERGIEADTAAFNRKYLYELAEGVNFMPHCAELGSRKPTKYEVVKKIAEALNTTPEYLLGNSGMLVLAAQEQGGAKAAREIDELVSEVSGMFAGGSLSEDALDGAMQALTRAYWIAKEKNKKYTPKKYRKEQTEE